jgi:hypothetical protein
MADAAVPGLDLALAALDQNEKNYDEKNSCNNANNGSCIHAILLKRVMEL